ncbi:hypothetical protein HHI36_010308 [Cryptolaemus montrouzieri]|uniref:Uncharacterized protein n=1 Tax=Cryptolaemus montrouzieri TaxID=559131 RepID=A0ABD2MIC5_9CUCU
MVLQGKKYNMRSLENPQISADFEENMNIRIESINENTNTTSPHVNTYWEEIRDTIKPVTEEIVGTGNTKTKNQWFDEDCQIVTERKSEAWKKMQTRKMRITT